MPARELAQSSWYGRQLCLPVDEEQSTRLSNDAETVLLSHGLENVLVEDTCPAISTLLPLG
jgi:hypothetical protein